MFWSLLSRCYFTVVMAVIAWFGTDQLRVAKWVILTGVLLDLARNFVADDLTLRSDRLVADFAETRHSAGGVDTTTRFFAIIYAGMAAYILLILGIDVVAGTEFLVPYLRLFDFLYEFFARFIAIIRNHDGELRGIGRPDRAALAVHVYSVSIAFIVLSTFALSLRVHRFTIANRRSRSPQIVARNASAKHFGLKVFGFAMPLMLLIYWSQINRTFVTRGIFPWPIDVSDGPFIFLIVWNVCMALWLYTLYGSIYAMRVMHLSRR